MDTVELSEQYSVEIPHQVVVRCPLERFDLRRAGQCAGCEHFAGLTQMFGREGGLGAPFHKAFAVRCRYPQDRELQTLTGD